MLGPFGIKQTFGRRRQKWSDQISVLEIFLGFIFYILTLTVAVIVTVPVQRVGFRTDFGVKCTQMTHNPSSTIECHAVTRPVCPCAAHNLSCKSKSRPLSKCQPKPISSRYVLPCQCISVPPPCQIPHTTVALCLKQFLSGAGIWNLKTTPSFHGGGAAGPGLSIRTTRPRSWKVCGSTAAQFGLRVRALRSIFSTRGMGTLRLAMHDNSIPWPTIVTPGVCHCPCPLQAEVRGLFTGFGGLDRRSICWCWVHGGWRGAGPDTKGAVGGGGILGSASVFPPPFGVVHCTAPALVVR